ncbi:MAG TPA: AraC family transcriptional regulator [Methylobacterium sp.]|jgi:AraC-like DNA-binding protein|uniref:helix-turn-helix domain-containing protein n=1 Tax=Methylorubrum sp. B1-46 TaxID=2897334 RepID=UPI001E3B07BD|nr:AraC family transcriptional regulator [Methylorubrum sp. B1-46]UGB25306.1 AraC family transcriptional regulator [Methylorubrum sp. B1-46]HEV2543594.1 AraC family transcriptional regulator [Methylobacterium sp.]
MSVPFVNASVQGELSAPPDQIFGQIPASGLDGVAFLDFAYESAGYSTHRVDGLLVGTWQGTSHNTWRNPWHPGPEDRPGDRRTRLTFRGGAMPDERAEERIADAFVLRGPGFVGSTAWSGPCRGRYLAYMPAAVERMIEAPISQAEIPTLTDDLSERMSVFHLLAALGQEAGGHDTAADALLVDSVALAVLRVSGALAPSSPRRNAALTARQARRVRDLVAARIDAPLSLREMAEAAGLSEGYFVRAFKGSFGVTPYQYVLRERVTLAQSLIRSGTVSLGEAAKRAGFPDARRMGRTFRKVIGRSPTEAARLQRA